MLAYRVVLQFLRFVVGRYFKQVEVVGLEHIPPEGNGPVIFAGNHPNSLLDPVLITTSCGRIVHFAAKDVLFKSAPLRVFLSSMGAVPIARRVDHGAEGAIDNQDAFEALYRVLGEGRAMGIFPEGLSHDEAQLARLKTGAARIAFGACESYPDTPLMMVPCGLNYTDRRRFRSRVLVQFGPPIVIDRPWLDRWKRAEREEVRALTDQLEKALRGLTVNSSDWDTMRVIDGVRRLYQPPEVTLEERAELARRFATAYETLKDRPDVHALIERVRRYLDWLTEARLSDRDLRRTVSTVEVLRRFARNAFFAFFWLPLAIPGLPIFVPIALAIRALAPRFAPRKDVLGTTKFVLGLIALVGIFAAIPLVALWRGGLVYGALAAVTLLITGTASIKVMERAAALTSIGVSFTQLLFLRREIDALRAERASLETAVIEAVGRLRPADMVPVFADRAGAGRTREPEPQEPVS